MDDDVRVRLDAVILLLGVAVSLLAGLVLGGGSAAVRTYAVVSFVALGAVLALVGVGRDRS